MAQPPAQHHCKDCGLFFDSSKSLDVHLHYHSDNLMSRWKSQAAGNDESNNNVKSAKSRIAAAAADSSDNLMDRFSPSYNFVGRGTPPVGFQHYQTVPKSEASEENGGFILGTGVGFPKLPARTALPANPPSPHMPTSSYGRFHPYQGYPEHRNGNVTSSSPAPNQGQTAQPQQCDKCGYVCESGQLLLEHLQSGNCAPVSAFGFDNGYERRLQVKEEPQSEILDLDSQKVLYQPQQGDEEESNGGQHSVSSMLSNSWRNSEQDKKVFHALHDSVPSPDFSNVSTTTLTPPQQDLPYRQFDMTPPMHHISSTQVPSDSHSGQKGSGKSGGSWKSNEARRPKTYNCSACNKWFTSSGHLKRHYNTTLHKNAVKQNGGPDPAVLPISVHHHPQKDTTYAQEPSPPPKIEEPPLSGLPVKIEDNSYDHLPPPPPHLQHASQLSVNHFLPSPPNLVAGPSASTGGLLLHSTQQFQEETRSPQPPTHSQHQNFLHFPPQTQTIQSFHQTSGMYPNFQPPHVTSTQPVTNNTITGNYDTLEQQLNDIQPFWRSNFATPNSMETLPSFNQIIHQFGVLNPGYSAFTGYQQVVSSTENVGGLSPNQSYDSIYQQSPEENYSLENLSNPYSPPNENDIDTDSTVSECAPAESPTSTHEEPKPLEVVRVEMIKVEENSVSSTIERNSPLPPEHQPHPVHKCVDCDKFFNGACYLTQHNKRFHSGDKPFKCSRCGKRFPDEYQHLEHQSKHAGEKPYKCEICPKQFNHKTDLRRHMCLHTGDKPYACDTCGKGFIRKDHMMKHCDTHKKRQLPGNIRVRRDISHPDRGHVFKGEPQEHAFSLVHDQHPPLGLTRVLPVQ